MGREGLAVKPSRGEPDQKRSRLVRMMQYNIMGERSKKSESAGDCLKVSPGSQRHIWDQGTVRSVKKWKELIY